MADATVNAVQTPSGMPIRMVPQGDPHAQYDPGVPRHIEYPRQPLPALLRAAARLYPRRAALIFQGARTSFRALDRMADACAAGLQAAGVRPGDRVALVLPNVPQYPIAFFGALRAGAVVVGCNPLYTPSELAHQLVDCGAETVIALDRFVPTVREAISLAARQGTPTAVRRLYSADVAPFLPPTLRAVYRLKQRKAGVRSPQRHRDTEERKLSFEMLLKEFRGRAYEEVERAPEDLAVLQYTGGTTGRAKGAMLSHGSLMANAVQSWSWNPDARRGVEVVLCVAPFFHIYGLSVGINLALFGGATMVLLPRFQAADVVQAIRRYRPTIFPGVPTMYVAIADLAEQGRVDCSSLKVCISGAAPLPLEVKERFEQLTGGVLVEGYGLSEASPCTHFNPLRGPSVPGSIGLPYPDTEVRLDAAALPGNDDPSLGEMLIRGPQVMLGYWNRPEETAATLQDGWLRTGDIARVDVAGYYHIVDRVKDLIIAGGLNVYPREVEEVLYTHPLVREAAVVGVPDRYRGETVKAYIVLRTRGTGGTLTTEAQRHRESTERQKEHTEEERERALENGASDLRAIEESIIAHCRAYLAPYKVPKVIEFRDELPTSAVGKILRRSLRAQPISDGRQADVSS